MAERTVLHLGLGGEDANGIAPGLPVLAGEATERVFREARPAGRHGSFALFTLDDWLLGAASVHRRGRLEDECRQLYLAMLAATGSRRLVRIWNYVPAINALDDEGLEHYRAFCRGRSLAFEEALGRDFKALVPSASAVGSKSDRLTVLFAACTTAPRHVENPLQVPAYDYPPEYGPRAPSFARATLVPHPRRPMIFISGTAAIRGHTTIAPDCTRTQLACLIENLREISRACGLGSDLSAGPGGTRHFKVYLRHATDLPLVAQGLEAGLFGAGDKVSYLEADICRAPLNVEVEATLLPAPRGNTAPATAAAAQE